MIRDGSVLLGLGCLFNLFDVPTSVELLFSCVVEVEVELCGRAIANSNHKTMQWEIINKFERVLFIVFKKKKKKLDAS